MTSKNQDFLTGVAAGMATAVNHLYHPFEVLKLRRQSHDGGSSYRNLVPKYSRNTAKALLEIFQKEGIPGLYRGVTATLSISIFTYTLYFSVYERTKRAIRPTGIFTEEKHVVFVSSAVSGVFIQLLTQPLWAVKTRLLLQTDSPKRNEMDLKKAMRTLRAIREIRVDYGWAGFYRGLSLSLIMVQQSSIQLSFYEYFLRNFTTKSSSVSWESTLSGVAGILGKIMAQVFLAPVCLLRTRYQQKELRESDGTAKYKGYIDIIGKIWQHEGVHGFYKGLFAGLLRSLPTNGTFYVFFHFFKRMLIVEADQANK